MQLIFVEVFTRIVKQPTWLFTNSLASMFYIAKKDLDIHYSVNVQVGYLFSDFVLLQINELAREHLLELLLSSRIHKTMSSLSLSCPIITNYQRSTHITFVIEKQ